MKTKIKNLSIVFFTFLFGIIAACSSDNDNSIAGKKASFKVVGSNGANISTIVYALGSETFPVTNVNNTSWSSQEITIPNNVNTLSLSGNATGTSQSSSIRLEIYVNGQLKKQQTTSGTVMSTFTQYTIN